jgi:hypothetical protein
MTASISWADVSKAKPRAARPTIGHTHAGRRSQRGAGKRRCRRRRRCIPATGGRRQGGGLGATAEEEGRGPPPRRDQGLGVVGAARRGGPPCRGDAPHRGRRCASVRADVGAAELAGGGRWRCARVGEERRGASERSGAARQRRWARRGRARRGEAAATATEE